MPGQFLAAQLDNCFDNLPGVAFFQEIKFRIAVNVYIGLKLRCFPRSNPVGIQNDRAFPVLSENFL